MTMKRVVSISGKKSQWHVSRIRRHPIVPRSPSLFESLLDGAGVKLETSLPALDYSPPSFNSTVLLARVFAHDCDARANNKEVERLSPEQRSPLAPSLRGFLFGVHYCLVSYECNPAQNGQDFVANEWHESITEICGIRVICWPSLVPACPG